MAENNGEKDFIKDKGAEKMVDFRTDSQIPMDHEKLSKWEESSRETELIRDLSLEERQTVTNKTIAIFQNLATLLESDDYNEDLRKELRKSNPNYLIVLTNRIKDLQKSDHGLVVSGETSAGKSTLINKILGKQIFKGKVTESTSTICKIRNSDRLLVVTENESGEKDEQDLTDKYNIGTKKGVTRLRKFLEQRTGQKAIDKNIRSVDIGFPIHFLKGNTILVDTPGIGGSGEVTHKLKEYLPNALSFIFVINASNAGGFQNDRLPEILKEIGKLVFESEMPCFHPESVIFLVNKWDLVLHQTKDEDDNDDDDDDDDEDDDSDNDDDDDDLNHNEAEQIWETLKHNIHQAWPSVKDDHIFRLTLKEVSKRKNNASTKTFANFQKFRGDHIAKTNDTIKAVVQECERSMSTSAGKYDVLNPKGRKPIAEVDWNKTNFEKEIRARVDLYVVEFLKSEGVLKKFKEISEEIREFRQKIKSSLEVMENKWARLNPDVEETESSTFLIQLGLLTSPVWIVALAFGFGIPAAIIGTIVFAVSSFFGLVVKTTKEIDDEYYKCIKSVPERMHTLLEKQCGSNIRLMVERVTKELLQDAEALNERLHQISEKRNEILANRKGLLRLVTQINTMETSVTKLREDLNL